jgi:hypothetical protein
MRARRCALVCASLASMGTVGTAAFVLGAPGSALADSGNRFSLTAQGDAMYFEVDYPDIPASPNNSAGSLTAESELDSTGNSSAFAGAPYFGKTVQTLPGTVNGIPGGFGLGGLQVPFSTLPGYVTTRYPSIPKAEDAQAHYRVLAASKELSSSASGTNGAPAGIPAPNQQQTATASTRADPDGSTVSEAVGSVSGLVSGPLELGNSTAQATITTGKDGKSTITSRSFGRFSVSGQEFGFDQKGVRYLGRTSDPKDALAQANTALKNANIQLDIAPVETAVNQVSGATSYLIGGLRLTTVQSIPGQAAATLVYVLGRAQVSAVNLPLGVSVARGTAPAAKAGATTLGAVPAGAGPAAAPSAPTVGAVAPAVAPGAALPAVTDASMTDPNASPATAAEPAAGETLPRTPAFVAAASVLGGDSQWLYLILVLTGAVVFGGQQLFSRIAVRVAGGCSR